MNLAVKRYCPPTRFKVLSCPVDREIRDFVVGKSDGEDLLHAIYDHVLDEPVPERLLALLKR